MSADDMFDQYATYEGRLASFHKASKKRGSTTSGKRAPKALSWPNKHIAPASLARAGFYFNPGPENPDNVTCFLCSKGLDGWEAGDDPLLEHLKHSSDCGWAIVAAVEAEVGDYATEDPNQPFMKEARKATFAGRWPHDAKKGWKCKTKQLVDAGWKYTPTEDSDDMATCVYCQLALDGWEPADKPLDEHYNRSPNCAFFTLLEHTKANKKTSRAKGARASKASRLSVQSVATATSEAPSVTELTAGPEDSVLTTTSTAQGAKKGKGRKAAAGKGKKAAKDEVPVEEIGGPAEEEEEEEALPPPMPARGKKRDSAAVEDSVLTTSEAPAPKKRATRKGSVAVNSSTVDEADGMDVDETAAPAPKKGGRKKATKATRKASTASVTSAASSPPPPGSFPDDDEIERQLEADLARPLSDDEDVTLDSDSERVKKARKSSTVRGAGVSAGEGSKNYEMFAPAPAEADDAEIEDELQALQAEMQMDEPQELHVPKKGRKAGGTRKASKQTKAKKTKPAPAPPVEPEPEQEEDHEEQEAQVVEPVWEPEPEAVAEPVEEDSLASTSTVIKKTESSRASSGKRGRGRPSKASLASQQSIDEVELVEEPAPVVEKPEPPVKRGRGRPPKASLSSQTSAVEEQAPVKRPRGRPPKKSLEARKSLEAQMSHEQQQEASVVNGQEEEQEEQVQAKEPAATQVVSFEDPKSPTVLDEASSPVLSTTDHLAQPPSTPGRIISPAPSARQAAISPSQSPQASDAENQPPSSVPAPSTNPKRVALAPVAATPTTRGSPSKRNVIAGLRSTTPWTELDVEAVFGTPGKNGGGDKENASAAVEGLLRQGASLTSPEKQMTVEEWIYHNAGEAEKKLRHECESMVSRFENEGSRAMRVLEGLVVD